MPPRNDDTPRRGSDPRRGASSDDRAAAGRDRGQGTDGGRGRRSSGIGDARAYTPRGRTVREGDQRTRSPRAGRTDDPFRPALQVLDGGRAPRERRGDDAPPPQRGETAGREAKGSRSVEERRTRERTGKDRTAKDRAARDRGVREQETRERGRGTRVRAQPVRETERTTRRRTAEEPDRPRRSDPARTIAGSGRGRATADPRRGATGRLGGSAGSGRPPARPRPVPVQPPEPPKLANTTRRLRLGTVLALTLFAAIGVRLVVLQVVESPAQAKSVLEQRQKRIVEVELAAPRGSILDESGSVLAHSVEARSIFADPTLVEDPAAAAAQLSPLLGVPQSKLAQLMAQQKRSDGRPSRFEYLARGVDISVATAVKKLDLDGIGSERDERRDVPGADLAANLIGFTGDNNTGLEGLEARYDDLLRGTDGLRRNEVGQGDLAKVIPGGYHFEKKALPGSSLQLTINRYLQFDVQRYLQEYMEQVNATVGGAVVIDARTGEVKAQASYPTYNAQKPLDFEPEERGDAVSSVISDPGSTHKAFTIGAALEEGLITKDSEITVGPAMKLGGTWFEDTHAFPSGTKLTVGQVMAYSSNVGSIRIGQMLGKEKLYEYQQKFGLGRQTNEGMPGEAAGALLEPDKWSGSAWGSVPIGHSVDATLLQMAAGYAAIANDGVYIQPRLVKATISGTDGTATPVDPPETHRVLSAKAAADLREIMEGVVDAKDATGGRAKVEGYRVAGKTGTGKMLVDGQYTSHNAGSFIGMAPAENPRFVIGVFADVPDGTGGDVAAPAFSKMMGAALQRYLVPPSSTPAPKFDWKH